MVSGGMVIYLDRGRSLAVRFHKVFQSGRVGSIASALVRQHTDRGGMTTVVITSIHALTLLLLLQLLRLTSHEILSQLVVATAAFKSFQQVLAIDVLNYGPLDHHCRDIKTLKDPIAT